MFHTHTGMQWLRVALMVKMQPVATPFLTCSWLLVLLELQPLQLLLPAL